MPGFGRMSSIEVDACVEILDDHFGPIAAAVGNVLLSEAVPLPVIFQRLRNQFRISEVSFCEILILICGSCLVLCFSDHN